MLKETLKKPLSTIYNRIFAPAVNYLFFNQLIFKTQNFHWTKWLGQRIKQNIFDLQTIQETIFEVKPEFLIECGTNHGGSAKFYADIFNIIGKGHVITIDNKQYPAVSSLLSHGRITFLLGSSVSEDVSVQVKGIIEGAQGPVMVILDSSHAYDHVKKELDLYTKLVTVGSYCLCQDGVSDQRIPFRIKAPPPGPLPAIKEFIKTNQNFIVDYEKCNRFLITHHPMGWLKRLS